VLNPKAVAVSLLTLLVPALGLAQVDPIVAEPASDISPEEWQRLVDLSPAEIPMHLVKILRTTNKAQVNRYVGKVYDFKNVNPGQVNNYFHSALFREEGAAYTFLGPDGASGKILVICPAYQLEYFDNLARSLDRSELTSAPGSTYVYKQLNHRSAADADFITVARQYATVGGVVVGDIETNALFTFDAPSGADYLMANLDLFLDKPTPVVNTRVKIYEVDVNNDGTVGLDYEDYKNGPYQNMLVGVINYSNLNADASMNGVSGDVSRETKVTSSLVDLQYPSAFFDFLVQKGKARIVTETQLTTSNKKDARLFAGEQILYYNVNDNPDTLSRTVTGTAQDAKIPVEVAPRYHNAGGVVVEAVDAGIRVLLRPVIGEEEIKLDIDASVISLRGFTDKGAPLLNSRRADTSISVRNGEEMVLGGLIREQQAKRSYKMPILGSIPILGWLFGGETDNLQRSMVVIVVQPEIETVYANVDAEELDVMAVATGEKPPTIPEAAYGFDMLLLDSDKEAGQ
jgi:type II secretory pathway component GspD/PulD (secretin)